MSVTDLQELHAYGHWANRKLLDALSALSDQEFTRNVAGSYGSIRNTFVHALSAEWGWLGRCGAQPDRGARLKSEDYPTLQSVVDLSRKVEKIAQEFLPTLTDADLGRILEFSFAPPDTYRMTVEQTLRHGAIHSAHHRGQVSLLCRMLGHAPGNIDAVFYYAGDVGLR
jgi:uncharacterized damage-inducible protein DinB